MDFIDIDTIQRSWDSMEDMDVENIPKLINTLGKKQPFLLAYLMATGSDLLSTQEREALLFMGVMIWQIVNANKNNIPKITNEALLNTESQNIQMLEYLAGEPEVDFANTVEKIMSKYHQVELLRFIIDKLMEEPQKGIELSDDNMGMIVIYLKTIIDCLDAVID